LDEASGGDPEIKTALLRGWANRRHWPPSTLPVGIAFVIAGQGSKPSDAASALEILEAFEKRVAAAREALTGTNENHMAGTIMVAPGVTKTRAAALKWFMNHLIHHRGQLSVYLRLLDVSVPGMYGSSGDENSS
jgi:uncharacterized damage-inducible protein DinB